MAEPNPKHIRMESITDYKLCVKCQILDGELVSNPNSHSYEKFLACIHERAHYGEPGFPPISSRLAGVSAEDLQSIGASWHRECYQYVVHKLKKERAKNRFQKSINNQNVTIVLSSGVGRPSRCQSTNVSTCSDPESKPFTRAALATYSREKCLFCNADNATELLHEVRSFITGRKIREVVNNSGNNEWKVRLDAISPDDARAIDVKYHLSCYVKNVQRHEKNESVKTDEQFDQDQRSILADIEYCNMMTSLLQSGDIISMNDATGAYISIRKLHGVHETSVIRNKQVKEKIVEHIPDVEFSRPSKREPERLCSKITIDAAVKTEEMSRNTQEEMKCVFQCARILRKDILNGRDGRWTFDGSLNSNRRHKSIPASLTGIMRLIIEGPSTSLSVGRAEDIHRSSLNIAQTLMYEVKTARQIAYNPRTEDTSFRHTKCDNELVLAVGFKVHTYSRSKHLVNFFHALGISVNYTQLLRLETQLAHAVIRRTAETGGIYIPPGLEQNIPVFFAVDNIDFSEDTHDGKNTLHGTVLVAFQENRGGPTIAASLRIDGNASERSLQNYTGIAIHNSGIEGTPKPTQSPKYPDFASTRDTT